MSPRVNANLRKRVAGSLLTLGCLTMTLAAAAQVDLPAGDQAMAELASLDESPSAPTAPLPSLPALFDQALRHDTYLSQQRYELDATHQEIPMAQARLKPELSASGGYLWQDSTNIQTVGDSDLGQPATRPGEFDEHWWSLQLRQPLFSLERWRQVNLAESQVSAAELDVALVERDLALSVSEAYINAYLASRTLGLLEAQQELLELQVRQAQRAFDLGIGDRINLLEAQSRFDQAIADAVQAENDLDDALSELERLTGSIPDFSDRQLGELRVNKISQNFATEEELLELVGNNLDVLRALAEQEIASSDTQVRKSGYFPEVNLNLSYNDRTSDDHLRQSEDYTASVEVSVPLYRGGYTVASVRQGELRTQATREGIANARNLATQEVRQRLRAINGGLRRMEALEQAINSSQLFLEAAERGEQLGLRDLVDVLDARANLYDQRIQFVDAMGRYLIDRLALQSAVGELGSQELASVTTLLLSVSTP